MQIIRFSSGSFFVILKNTVRVRLRFGKNSINPVYKTPVRVRFNFLLKTVSRNFSCDHVKMAHKSIFTVTQE